MVAITKLRALDNAPGERGVSRITKGSRGPSYAEAPEGRPGGRLFPQKVTFAKWLTKRYKLQTLF